MVRNQPECASHRHSASVLPRPPDSQVRRQSSSGQPDACRDGHCSPTSQLHGRTGPAESAPAWLQASVERAECCGTSLNLPPISTPLRSCPALSDHQVRRQSSLGQPDACRDGHCSPASQLHGRTGPAETAPAWLEASVERAECCGTSLSSLNYFVAHRHSLRFGLAPPARPSGPTPKFVCGLL